MVLVVLVRIDIDDLPRLALPKVCNSLAAVKQVGKTIASDSVY